MLQLLGRSVGPVGYGLMGLTRPEAPISRERNFAVMNKALECGANYWNAGEFYGTTKFNSLHLLHDYFSHYPEKASQVVLCIKGGRTPAGLNFAFHFDGKLPGVSRSIEECLRVLDGNKSIDIFECARTDPTTPIEETVSILAQFVKQGKIGGIGLSEVRAETVRRAQNVHPIAQVEIEFSLWSPDPLRNGIVDTCSELGIPIIAYSPLSRGGLTDSFSRNALELPEHLKILPRFQAAHYNTNLRLTDQVATLARSRGYSVAQLALGWLRGLSQTAGRGIIIPIPGAENEVWIEENCREVRLDDSIMKELADLLQTCEILGERYGGQVEELCNG